MHAIIANGQFLSSFLVQVSNDQKLKLRLVTAEEAPPHCHPQLSGQPAAQEEGNPWQQDSGPHELSLLECCCSCVPRAFLLLGSRGRAEGVPED